MMRTAWWAAIVAAGIFLGVNATPARAATPAAAPEVISARDAAALKEALDTLEGVLGELDAKVDAMQAEVKNPEATKEALGTIRGQLVAIDGTLRAATLAASAPKGGDVAVAPAGDASPAPAASEEANAAEAAASDSQTASIFSALRNAKGAPWLIGGLVLIATAAGLKMSNRRRFRTA